MSTIEILLFTAFGLLTVMGLAIWLFAYAEDKAEQQRKAEALQRTQDEDRRVRDMEARVRASNERIEQHVRGRK